MVFVRCSANGISTIWTMYFISHSRARISFSQIEMLNISLVCFQHFIQLQISGWIRKTTTPLPHDNPNLFQREFGILIKCNKIYIKWMNCVLFARWRCVCVSVSVSVCAKMQLNIERMDLFAPTFQPPRIRFAEKVHTFELENKFQNTSFIQFILWKMLYFCIVREHVLHVIIPFFVSITITTNTADTRSLFKRTHTTTIEYFANILDFVLFIYLFFRSQFENGQKHVISHPFTKPFRQTHKHSVTHHTTHTRTHTFTKCVQ